MTSEWKGNDLEIRGRGVSGTIVVDADAVFINVKLGFAFAVMAGPIRNAIEEALDEHLG